MKYIRQAFVLTLGICLTTLLFAQTPANGSVPPKPVSNPAPAAAPGLSNTKPAAVPANSKKVKTVDKKKRKPAQVTTVKKPSSATQKNVK